MVSQLDFLNPEYTMLVGGELEKVHPSVADKKMLLKESSWFKPNDNQVGTALKESFKDYKNLLKRSRKHKQFTKDNFSFEKMKELIKQLFNDNVPQFAQQVELNLPKLKLPKLKKIDG